jgi:DNA-binding NarL/FixJ family response regulator
LACAGRCAEAVATATQAERMSRLFEARSTAACAHAIAALQTPDAAEDVALRHLAMIVASGYVDGLITAYRAFPPILAVGSRSESLRLALERAVIAGRDIPKAIEAGMPLPEAALAERSLTRRESEVLQLIARGATNRQAAIALYISEATVKVHLRHIFEKLGVRTRTQATLRALLDSSLTDAKAGNNGI